MVTLERENKAEIIISDTLTIWKSSKETPRRQGFIVVWRGNKTEGGDWCVTVLWRRKVLKSPFSSDKPRPVLFYKEIAVSGFGVFGVHASVCGVCGRQMKAGCLSGPPLPSQQAQCSCHPQPKLATGGPTSKSLSHLGLWIEADTQQPAEQAFNKEEKHNPENGSNGSRAYCQLAAVLWDNRKVQMNQKERNGRHLKNRGGRVIEGQPQNGEASINIFLV